MVISMTRVVLVLVVILIVACAVLLGFSTTPALELPPLTALGTATPVSVHISDPHGVKHVSASIEQNGSSWSFYQHSQPARRFVWNRHQPPVAIQFTAGTKTAPQLKDGPATLIVEATSNDFRASTATVRRDVTVVTRPPMLSVDADQHYLYRGMADLVTFTISGQWSQAGVKVDGQTFRSWPMPGGKPGQFALYAFAWNMPDSVVPLVFATNAAGNEVTGRMVYQFPKREQPHYRTRDLEITDQFMQKVVNELDPNGSGDMAERFVKINRDMRIANNKTLADLQYKTEPRFLWSQPFLQQHNSAVESAFADTRNYIYHGKRIDQETHLGYDFAITPHVTVEASNDGKVVYAAPLGIYGNCVVLDHGYALQTFYGHMSEFAVRVGDTVKRGQTLGRSGMTGMAAGDHIHFGMQLDGVQIDPKEFFDAHWIKDHIARRVSLP